jgi:hypothetical protein
MNKLIISHLKRNLSGKTCSPNISIISNDKKELTIGVLALDDISDILLAVKKLVLESKDMAKTFSFSIDREASEKQMELWGLDCRYFVTLYNWEKGKGWNYLILEYNDGDSEFFNINKNNKHWNNEMKKELDILEITSILQ